MAEEEKPSLRKRFRIATFSASEEAPSPVVEAPVGTPSVAFQQAVVPPRSPAKPVVEEKESRGLLKRARGVKKRRENDDEDVQVENNDSENNATSDAEGEATHRRVRKRVRSTDVNSDESSAEDPNVVVRVRAPREKTPARTSTRIDAKRQRRKDGRDAGRRRAPVLTEAEFLARRESVDRVMVVRQNLDRIQIAVLEDNILVEHYVSRGQSASLIGNVYLGKVQNVLPSMEAAFIDVGRGRNGVLYAGEVNWDAAGLDGQPKRIELALKTNDAVLVQVTKDPVGQKGARLTSQISLPGRYLVYVPDGSVTGISRKLPDTERTRLKRILKNIVPEGAGVIVRTAAEGATEEQLQRDVARLQAQWENIQSKVQGGTPASLLYSEPDLAIRVVRDIFNEDFKKLVVAGNEAWDTIEEYVKYVAPDLADRLEKYSGEQDVFAANRIDEQIAKALDRKVYLPSGGSLVIDRTEAMTVVDVNTGKFIGQGGNLEETVTKNNMEAAEEIVRQLRLRDIGGIIVIDFIDMVLETNRDMVLRRLVECLGRDRTKHQVAEVSTLGLVQMTRKRISSGLLETFSEACEHCNGRGVKVFSEPVDHKHSDRRVKREAPEQIEAETE
jgi:ribonuclease E